MSAEPVRVEDPNDPEVVLRDLPGQERAQFLRQYHQAVDAAHSPAGYQRLQRLLHAPRLTAITTSRAGYYDELEAVRSGTARTMPAQAFNALIAAMASVVGYPDERGLCVRGTCNSSKSSQQWRSTQESNGARIVKTSYLGSGYCLAPSPGGSGEPVEMLVCNRTESQG